MEVRGEHKAAWVTISTDEYESLLATIQTLSNPKAMAKIRQGEKERLEGKLVLLERLKKDLSL